MDESYKSMKCSLHTEGYINNVRRNTSHQYESGFVRGDTARHCDLTSVTQNRVTSAR